MSEWWSYGLSDFLMFSPQAYARLVGRHNAAWWPAQAGGLAACAFLLALLRQHKEPATRAALLLLAAAWAWVGWAFFAVLYAEIFLAAPALGIACAVQAALLVAGALLPARSDVMPRTPLRRAGWLLVAIALLFPLLGPAQGRDLAQAETFGFMPDPTALATVGALLALPRPAWQRIVLALVPAALLLLGAATRWLLA